MNKNLKMSIKPKVSGFVALKVINAETGEIDFESSFSNTIVDQFFTSSLFRSPTENTLWADIGLGQDGAPIAQNATDLVSPTVSKRSTGLINLSDAVNQAGITSVTGPTVDQDYLEIRFGPATTSAGLWVGTFSSIGLYSKDSSEPTTLMAGTQIKDDLGNPTSITLNSAQQVIVEYYIRIQRPAEQVLGPLTINGETKYVLLSYCKKDLTGYNGTDSLVNAFADNAVRGVIYEGSTQTTYNNLNYDWLTTFFNGTTFSPALDTITVVPPIYQILGGKYVQNYPALAVCTQNPFGVPYDVTSINIAGLGRNATGVAAIRTATNFVDGCLVLVTAAGALDSFTLPANNKLDVEVGFSPNRP